jgi:hypothetical protein
MIMALGVEITRRSWRQPCEYHRGLQQCLNACLRPAPMQSRPVRWEHLFGRPAGMLDLIRRRALRSKGHICLPATRKQRPTSVYMT